MGIGVKQIELGPLANFIYLIADPVSRDCAVVDPAWDVPEISKALADSGWNLSKIIITHNHPDHTNGIGGMLKDYDVPVYVHRADSHALREFGKNVRSSESGDKIRIGALEATLLHTPGHTEGSQCLWVEDRLVSGDTLFIGGCGRVDLPSSDPEKMYRSLRKIATLPDRTLVFPGHNYAEARCAPLLDEKAGNPYLKVSATRGLDDFLSLVGM